jgi:Predicted xylanase/chitin deacetylase
MFSKSIPILTYHSLDESRSVVSTSPSAFKKQMKYLWERSYKTLSVAEVINLIRKREPFPEKTFVITFDDGYKNVYTDAFPILERYGFKGTVFLIADYCGEFNNWPTQPRSIERRPLLSWSEINEMHNMGLNLEHTR